MKQKSLENREIHKSRRSTRKSIKKVIMVIYGNTKKKTRDPKTKSL